MPTSLIWQEKLLNRDRRKTDEIDDKLLIIPLKAVCETTDDVIKFINSIFNDIKSKKELTTFDIVRILKKGNGRRFADALILEPNFSGIGVNLKKLFNWGS